MIISPELITAGLDPSFISDDGERAAYQKFRDFVNTLPGIPTFSPRPTFDDITHYFMRFSRMAGLFMDTTSDTTTLTAALAVQLGCETRKPIEYEGYVYNPDAKVVKTPPPHNKIVELTDHENRMFDLLISNPGQVMKYPLIFRRVWPEYKHFDQDLMAHIRVYTRYLRQKIGDETRPPEAWHIQTIDRVGLRFAIQSVNQELLVSNRMLAGDVSASVQPNDDISPSYEIRFNPRVKETYRGCVLDASNLTLQMPSGAVVDLTPPQAAVFEAVMNAPDGVLDGQALARRIWPDKDLTHPVFYEGSLKSYMSRVDKKIRVALNFR